MQWLDGKEISESEYRAEMDLRTMIESEKIKQDPKRLKACMVRKRKLAKALASLMGSHNYRGRKKMTHNSHQTY